MSVLQKELPIRAFMNASLRCSAASKLHALHTCNLTAMPCRVAVVSMAKPSKKLPDRTVKIFCTNCRTQLYKYAKGEPLPQQRSFCALRTQG